MYKLDFKINKNSLYLILFFAFLTFYMMLESLLKHRSDISFVVIVSFIINGFIFLLNIIHCTKKHPFSLNLMHWVFYYFFFFIAALIQYLQNEFRWSYIPSDNQIIINNCIILIWSVIWMVSPKLMKFKNENNHRFIPINDHIYSIILPILITLTVLYVAHYGVSSIISTSNLTATTDDNIINLFYSKGILSAILIITVCLIYKYNKDKKNFFILIYCFLTILVLFPIFKISRNSVAVLYLPLVLVFIKSMKKKYRFIYLFVFGFILVFPILNAFRYTGIEEGTIQKISLIASNISNEYLSSNYDAYTMIFFVCDHIKNYGITYGLQIIGVFLFFVPRALWRNKPIGTGAMTQIALNKDFTNVSCPLIGEALINFGILGLFICPFILSIFINKLDNLYWGKKDDNNVYYIDIIYPILIPSFFFICRGELLSTFSYAAIPVIVGYVFYKIFLCIK